LQPSPEAIEWGKRKASTSPRWDDSKWNRIAIILGVEFTLTAEDHQADEHDHQDHQTMPDAA
jgi:hypothetical protein